MADQTPDRVQMTEAEWRAEGTRRFGDNVDAWMFVCPVCGHVASVRDWAEAGNRQAAGFSCVGRFIDGPVREALAVRRNAKSDTVEQPCNYAGGGLFRLNPVRVVSPDGHETQMFAFAGGR